MAPVTTSPVTQNAVYDVFVSYAHQDREAVQEVVQALRQANLTVFDWKEQRPRLWGQRFDTWLEQTLPPVRAMMPFLSEGYNQSPWCEREVQRALMRSVPILPIRLDSTLPPPLLQDIIWLDWQEITPEQIATTVKQHLATSVGEETVPLAALSEEELFELVAEKQDNTAFDILQTRLHPRIIRFAQAQGLSSVEAGRMATEVLRRLWEDAWRIARNMRVSNGYLPIWIEETIRRVQKEGMEYVEPASSALLPLSGMQEERFQNYFQRLSETDRAIQLRFSQGESDVKIADHLNLAVEEVRVRYYRIVEQVRSSLGLVSPTISQNGAYTR